MAGLAVLLLAILAFFVGRSAFGGKSGIPPPGRWNVVLVTIDTLRADYVGAYRTGRALTPALDALAKEGVRFEHCVAQAPLTLPSHASILSATQPLFHNVRDNGAFQVPKGLVLLSEVLQQQGLATAAFIGGYVLHGKWGLDQGFDLYSDQFDPGKQGNLVLLAKKPAGTVLGDARRWLDQLGDRRFFAWIHLYDPHFPYQPPAPFAERCGGDPYRGEVEYADSELGRFFDFLRQRGLYDRTLIVVTSDHGEGLGDHGEQKHGYFLYDSTLRVPLIFRLPKGDPVRTVTKTVQLVDVAPTVLDLLGTPAPLAWQGHSMKKLLAGEADDRFGVAYSETWYPRLHFGWSQLRAFVADRAKYIYAPREELYDLANDPEEKTNLASTRPPRRDLLRKKGLAFQQKHARGALTPGTIHDMPAEDRRRLAALGYLSGSPAQTAGEGSLPDPKDKLPDYIAFGRAVALLGEGRWPEALTEAQAIVLGNPEFADAVNLLGNAHFAGRQYPAALDAFRRALALKPDDAGTRQDLLKTLLALGKTAEAATAAEGFLRVAPGDPVLEAALGRIRLEQGRTEEGVALLGQALATDPGVYPQLNLAAETLIARKEGGQALMLLQLVLKANPGAAGSHYLLAQIAEGERRIDEAIAGYRRELKIDPLRFEAAVNLANLLKQGGDLPAAAGFYRMALAGNGKLKLPRFHLAEIMLRQRQDLPAAVELCLEGIALPPPDRETLFGYFVLTNLYSALGNAERRDFYTRQGEKLIVSLEKR